MANNPVSAAVAMAQNCEQSSSSMEARSYQLEMFEESMKRNIIVTMDTGSGKTQVAVMRIAAELERCQPGKRVWMLCPTVVLAQQQCLVLSQQLPAYQCRTLSSLDNVEHWKNPAIWQAALLNMDIIVSTPQVLYDALCHAFILLHDLALIVFDEAHHCQKGHAMNKIMQDFYHKATVDSGSTPCILGLTASPAKSAKNMAAIERNLDAICKAPKRHVEDLKLHVYQPLLQKLLYKIDPPVCCPMLDALDLIIRSFNIEQDPAIKFYRSDTRPQSQQMLQEYLENKTSPSLKDLTHLRKAADNILDELGLWATDHYLRAAIRRAAKVAYHPSALLPPIAHQQTTFLSSLLSGLLNLTKIAISPGSISSKVNTLINFLLQEHRDDINGIIFVQRRSTAVVLATLLSKDPRTCEKYKLSPFVGVSSDATRQRELVEIAETKMQDETLVRFRGGITSLLVSTSVLEEGIDVSATNLVIRFDLPPNLRSYIQSRGRARKAKSKFVMMLPERDQIATIEKWTNLEEEMKALYLQDQREIEATLATENIEEHSNLFLEDSTTGARLTVEEALRHLYHFCSALPQKQYVENRPAFILGFDGSGMKVAKVILPATIDVSLRETDSRMSWLTHRMAKKDCAFEAYKKLYRAGLVNSHLLPFEEPKEDPEIERRQSFANVATRFDMWSLAARERNELSRLFLTDIRIQSDQGDLEPLVLLLPFELRSSLSIPLFWNASTSFRAAVNPLSETVSVQADIYPILERITHNMLHSLFSKFLSKADSSPHQHPYLIVPQAQTHGFDAQNALTRITPELYYRPQFSELVDVESQDESFLYRGLIRRSDRPPHVRPFAYCSISRARNKRVRLELTDSSYMDIDQEDEELVCVEIKPLPKRLDYLHDFQSKDAHTSAAFVPARDCKYDPFPLKYARAMLFFPSICHRIELRLIAQMLNETILRPINIVDVTLVETAISAPSAEETSNYNRLEFLGDVLLKVYASFQLFAEHPLWHEGRLSLAKTSIINNGNLAKAAIACGLDPFIHTERFGKWRPANVEDLLSNARPMTRVLSTKTLADVVEAIIGASYMDGASESLEEEKTLSCLQVLLPGIRWSTLPNLATQIGSVFKAESSNNFTVPDALQSLLGYKFDHPTLLFTALTHGSSPPLSSQISSYQELEFLGDALLDKIIVETIIQQSNLALNPNKMTLIRHAIANAEILGYFCLSSSMDVPINEVSDPMTGGFTIRKAFETKYLWQFMRHSNHPDLLNAQRSSLDRFQILSPAVSHTISSGTTYPWLPLLRLRPEKFLSDIIESLLAAIYIDSAGNLDACRSWLRKLGILTYLERILADDIDCVHPKMLVGMKAGGRKVRYTVSTPDNNSFIRNGEEEALNPDIRLAHDINPTMVLPNSTPSQPKPTISTSFSSPSSSSSISSPVITTPPQTPTPPQRDPYMHPLLSGPYACTLAITNETRNNNNNIDAETIYATVDRGGSREEVEARAAILAIEKLDREQFQNWTDDWEGNMKMKSAESTEDEVADDDSDDDGNVGAPGADQEDIELTATDDAVEEGALRAWNVDTYY